MALYPIIMAGGSGTRFWPLSRKNRPKQFLPLTGDKPLLSLTADRVRPLAPPARTLVVCGKVHAPAVRKLLPDLPARNVLIEPVARNTAPAVGLAAAVVAHEDPEGVLVVLPSDQYVRDVVGFRKALSAAARAAEKGELVTIGIKPAHPETGFGFVQQGKVITEGALPVREVRRFVEKPNLETARGYLSSGDYLWNAGIFVFRADRILEEIERHLPETSEPLAAIGRSVGTKGFGRSLARYFPKMPSISLDYGVMEKASRIAVVPADFGWSDVGSFPALPGVRPLDPSGNVVEG
ncbi:MAG: mannose-1-phosphate guanylyltransferase, partial [Deltaproteobacteria bacterium]|nr:mannose-1-phosphate guanylyltransferase [Deltaproteobacteria bacterium]